MSEVKSQVEFWHLSDLIIASSVVSFHKLFKAKVKDSMTKSVITASKWGQGTVFNNFAAVS